MQQTAKYQFNLIEGGDDFSPNPLNENMEKVEAQLGTHAEALTKLTSDVGTGGKNARIALGTYTGTGKCGSAAPTTIQVDFTPVLVIMGKITPSSLYWPTILMRPMSEGISGGGYSMTVAWTANSVKLYSDSAGTQHNDSNYTYIYVVLGYSGS